MAYKKNYQIFLELLRSGLWGVSPDLSLFDATIEWWKVLEVGQEQTVVGVLTDGIAMLPNEMRG